MTVVAAEAAPNRADLVVNLELRLAYCAAEGRLWRLDAQGRIGRELKTWNPHKANGRPDTTTIKVPGIGIKRATHAIWFMLHGRWPLSGHVIDHRGRNPSNNRADNLREATVSQNAMNRDLGTRTRGAGELLEVGVQKRANGYAVILAGDYYGAYRNPTEANQIAREVRRRLYGEFALAPVTSRRMIRGRPAP
jgi:hypothetical protein